MAGGEERWRQQAEARATPGRALHTENLLAIACGCASLKNLKTKITRIRQTGNYNLDDIPTGP